MKTISDILLFWLLIPIVEWQEQEFDINKFIALLGAITGAMNILAIIYWGWKRNPKEVKKLEAEGESELADAAHVNLEGAKLSSTMLMDRIQELKSELDLEKKARREDAEYFRRRIQDIEVELRDYRNYAARLARQVIRAGLVPDPFISTLNETDPIIESITKEQEELKKAKEVRQKELKDAGDRDEASKGR